jgi:3-deoxy-7-phosphoheptulonate synthase
MKDLILVTEKKGNTYIKINDFEIGANFVIIAGPCAIESKKQLLDIGKLVKKSGADILRGGAYKPRTCPYKFQGLGEEGIKILKEVKEELDIPVITEVMDIRDFELVEDCADIIQIGARNMQNFPLLKRAGKTKKPVMLKRHAVSTIYEFLASAEYILASGNPQVILCERGIRTFEKLTRNTLDLAAIPIIKKLTHLPIFVDPSHGTGRRDLILPMTKGAIAVGSDGVMIEVHNDCDNALCDGEQSLPTEDFLKLMRKIKPYYW